MTSNAFLKAARPGLPTLLLCLFALVSPPALAQRFCYFDPLGKQGPINSVARDYALAAKRWGADLELHAYTEERVVPEDFKAGQCDIVLMPGLRVRAFNQFTGTIDAVGGIENYAQMRALMELMGSPKLDKLMVTGPYEVVGIMSVGAGYPFVNDRNINSLAKAAGKKVAIMDWDRSQAILVQQIGGQAVMSDLTNYAGKFNNGSVDLIVAPAVLYRPFELYKGLGSKGGIGRFPVIQLTFQLLTRRDKFPPDFGRQSREYAVRQIDFSLSMVRNQENEVDPKHWMYVPRANREGYTRIMRDARILLANEGFYDRRMLAIMKRVRCKSQPDDAECSLPEE